MSPRLVFALIFAVQLTIAHADNFKVYAPSVESGVTEIEYRAFRDFDRRDEINRSQTHKFGVGRGFNDYWASEVYGVFEKEGTEALKLEEIEWENLFQFAPRGKYWADTGLLVEYEHPMHRDDPGKLTFAPLIEKELGSSTVATLNLRFTRETGSRAESGTDLAYAARMKYNLNPGFEPALEFFGDFGRIHHFPSRSEQQHWLGPAFYGKVKVGQGQSLIYSAAALFGVTSAASDLRGVVRVEYEF